MERMEIVDKFNTEKVWVLTRYKCGHYHINQIIKGRKFYKRATRTSKQHFMEVLGGLV